MSNNPSFFEELKRRVGCSLKSGVIFQFLIDNRALQVVPITVFERKFRSTSNTGGKCQKGIKRGSVTCENSPEFQLFFPEFMLVVAINP